jgi:hypothetical protein
MSKQLELWLGMHESLMICLDSIPEQYNEGLNLGLSWIEYSA